jgi:hypothetical protein
MKSRFPWKVLSASAAGTAALAAFDLALRPWFMKWGAMDEEIKKAWPGDGLCPDAASVATRAVTIHAPAEEVWPWLVQIGQDRGGFYSYTWLENLFGARIHNADRLLPKVAPRQVGDTVWMTPPERYDSKGCMRVAQVEPGRALVLVSPDDYAKATTTGYASQGTWAFLLVPVDKHTTRLIVRSRSGAKVTAGRYLVFDPIHFIMERKMMLGIRDRAEAPKARRVAKAA